MTIENMTILDWFLLIGLGIVGGVLSFLVTSFIQWLRKEVKEND